MNAVADPTGAPGLTDTITVSLANTTAPYSIVYTDQAVITTGGNAPFNFPLAVLNGSYYVVFKHRNSLETWSKTPVLFNTPTKSIDLSIY
jgi:hypothetical protein